MKTPTIHSGGTSRNELFDAVMSARAAVMAAINSLGATYPNGRDYYPQGPEAIGQATDEYQDRMNHLQLVMGELNDLATAIQDI